MIFDSVMCDWLTISHRLDRPILPINGGRIMKIQPDGNIEWETSCWETLKCPSSDSSLRIRCDGQKLQLTGNIGRWMMPDNLTGLTVIQCVDRWADFIKSRGLDVPFFGSRVRARTVGEGGTVLTRLDLAANMWTDNFSALTQSVMSQKLGQKPSRMGLYGAMWGYETKRSNWVRAKLYDKTCEMEGRRTPSAGETVARFEIQLGSEFLRRHKLDLVSAWKEGFDMENIIYREFSNQVFRQQAMAENWKDIPPRIRQYAVLWRDGQDIRNICSKTAFYRVKSQLLKHGLDISQPCNVHSLTRRIVEVKVMPLQSRRVA